MDRISLSQICLTCPGKPVRIEASRFPFDLMVLRIAMKPHFFVLIVVLAVLSLAVSTEAFAQRTITVQLPNGTTQTVTVPNNVNLGKMPPGIKVLSGSVSSSANAVEDSEPEEDDDEDEAETPDPADEEIKAQVEARLEQLSSIQFNRLPSHILETWAKPTKFTKPNPDVDELPPAPKDAFLYSDARFAIALESLQDNFSSGNWTAVKAFMDQLPKGKRRPFYLSILNAATGSTAMTLQGGDDADPRTLQPQYLSYEDIFEIANIAPEKKIKNSYLPLFAMAFSQVIQRGAAHDDLIKRFKAELEKDEPILTRRQIAKLLMASGRAIFAEEFMPTLEKASQDNDHEALNMLSNLSLAKYSKDDKKEDIESAWNVTQAILSAKDVDPKERKKALSRAVELSSKVSEKLGKKWLDESFVAKPEIGIEVLAEIGIDASKSLFENASNPMARLQALKLQNDAVEAFLKTAGKEAKKWRPQLELLAQNWLREALVTYDEDDSTQLGPSMRRDQYGNIFYYQPEENDDGYRYNYRYSTVDPIGTGDIVELTPSKEWMEMMDPTLMPKFDKVRAQLYLKVAEQDLALPFIEGLAKTHPEEAEELVSEFLNVWTANHDPNAARRRTNYYMYMYGYESRAESIPLTRSKQVRNLDELSEIVPRLTKIVGEDKVDEELLVRAFMGCHSSAEVYKAKDIERVFGKIEEIKPETVAELTNKMRSMLATMWRDIKEQKDKKTKRKKQEIEEEVIEGYETARDLLDRAIGAHPDEWSLMVTNASLIHDENNYRAEIKNSKEFSPRRAKALNEFKRAAEKYIDKLDEIEGAKFSTRAFETWFYASLGACDLSLIKESHLPDLKQTELIRKAIDSMGKEAKEWHMTRFANLLFNRMSSVKPELKQQYLDAGFSIVGDHKAAKEAKQVHDYYRDLVSEIKLVAEVDGTDRVGTGKPFGILISIDHTKEIERESGGFGRYLQNQNTNNYYSYNYGRPTQDYRDKFDELVRRLLEDQFEVHSVTFQTPDVKSIAKDKDGWRRTPYAYILLEARGAEVDTIPPMKLSLDFLDTSGYAILPIESNSIPIDAAETADPRPANNIQITQILDERQAEDNKMIVEIKGVAHGLVPDLEDIFDTDIEQFDIKEIEDEGVAVSQFDPEEIQPVIKSERNWLITYEPKAGLDVKPASFSFPSPTIEPKEIVYQRYEDADLATVEPSVSLLERYKGPAKQSYAMYIVAALGLLCLVFACILIPLMLRRPAKQKTQAMKIDDSISPFVALSMLQKLKNENGFTDSQSRDLDGLISQVEANFFDQSQGESNINLPEEVKKWSRLAKIPVA
jgi:hypothetical protein